MNERISLGLESVLWEMVLNANEKVKADGCSLFLLDEETDKYVLRESTRLTPFLNNYCINITETEETRYKNHRRSGLLPEKDEENLKNIGITVFTILDKNPLLVPDVSKDVRWRALDSPLLQ